MKDPEKFSFKILDMELTSKMQTDFLSPSREHRKFQQKEKLLATEALDLGLTIVRLLANNIGCRVQFVGPEDGFNTAFSIQWRDSRSE